MQKPTILVADDDRHVRAAIRRRLLALDYRVIESSDGLGVLGHCVAGQVDAVLLDHGMPNGDGRSIARVIRNESDVLIVFVSGYAKEHFRSIVTELSDVYFLAKPFDDERLERLLASIVGHTRAASSPEASLAAQTRACG